MTVTQSDIIIITITAEQIKRQLSTDKLTFPMPYPAYQAEDKPSLQIDCDFISTLAHGDLGLNIGRLFILKQSIKSIDDVMGIF